MASSARSDEENLSSDTEHEEMSELKVWGLWEKGFSAVVQKLTAVGRQRILGDK